MGRDRNSAEAASDGLLRFMSENLTAMAERLPKETVGRLPRFFSGLCGADKAAQLEQLFAARVGAFEGGTSTLKQTLETMRLCAVYRDLQQASLSAILLRS